MRTFLEVRTMSDVSLTGIGETVCRLAECALGDTEANVHFISGSTEIPRAVVEEVIQSQTGRMLKIFLESGAGQALEIDPSDWNGCIFTHRVSMERTFDRHAMIIYDLTPFIVPQYHSEFVVHDFTRNFLKEVSACDRLVAISESAHSDLVTYFPDTRERASVAYCGLHPSLLTHPAAVLPPHLLDKPFFMSLGTLEPRKNNLLTLRMLAEHPDLLLAYRFLFVGKRGWGEDFAAQIERLGLSGAVARGDIVFTGFVDDQVKRALLARSTALIYPSFYEGFGLPVAEAMALGRPVVCQPTTSIPEVAGKWGYYLDAPTTDELYDAIRRCVMDLDNDDLAAGRRQAVERFSWPGMWQHLKEAVAPVGEPKA